MIKTSSVLIFIIAYSLSIYGQKDSTSSILKHNLPAIGIGAGLLSFYGDLGGIKDDALARNTVGLNIGIAQRIRKSWGIEISGMKGVLAQNNRIPYTLQSFQSTFMQGSAQLSYHFDNGLILRRSSLVAPYLTIGIGYMTFDPKGDLLDKNNKKYYYWDLDNSFRDQPYDANNPQLGNKLIRDHVFETDLDSTNLYKKSTIVIPIGAGVKFKLTNRLDTRLNLTYFFTQTDFIDNYRSSSKSNDGYLYMSVSIHFNLSSTPSSKNPQYKGIDFKAIDDLDADGDGVKDMDDQCQETPSGATVDAKGCPLDKDEDGVPDYVDKEPNTPKGNTIDEFGVTMTDAMLISEFLKDSLIGKGMKINSRDTIYHKPTSSQPFINTKPTQTIITTPTNTVATKQQTENTSVNPITTQATQTTTRPTSSQQPNTNIIYRIQITSLVTDAKSVAVKNMYNLNEPIYIYPTDNMFKYSIGSYSSYKQATEACNEWNKAHNGNSFVIALHQGKLISTWEAQKLNGE